MAVLACCANFNCQSDPLRHFDLVIDVPELLPLGLIEDSLEVIETLHVARVLAVVLHALGEFRPALVLAARIREVPAVQALGRVLAGEPQVLPKVTARTRVVALRSAAAKLASLQLPRISIGGPRCSQSIAATVSTAPGCGSGAAATRSRHLGLAPRPATRARTGSSG